MRRIFIVAAATALTGCSLVDDLTSGRRRGGEPHAARPGAVIGEVVWKPIAGETAASALQLASRTCAEYGLTAVDQSQTADLALARLRYSCEAAPVE
jgi:hypothetical protein